MRVWPCAQPTRLPADERGQRHALPMFIASNLIGERLQIDIAHVNDQVEVLSTPKW
jgi:hypothetical protein